MPEEGNRNMLVMLPANWRPYQLRRLIQRHILTQAGIMWRAFMAGTSSGDGRYATTASSSGCKRKVIFRQDAEQAFACQPLPSYVQRRQEVCLRTVLGICWSGIFSNNCMVRAKGGVRTDD